MPVHADQLTVESSVIADAPDRGVPLTRSARLPPQQSFTARDHLANLDAIVVDFEQAQLI
jgi:hypothetical protein